MKIALVSTGLSHIQRGYETFMLDLFEVMRDVVDVKLFKGSGAAEKGMVTVPCVHRSSALAQKRYPESEHKRYWLEQVTMASAGWLQGHWQGRTIIHFCDTSFGNGLLKFRNAFNHKYQLLFANCGPVLPDHYRKYDHIQEFTPEYLEQARKSIRKTKLTLIPMGIWPERFQPEAFSGEKSPEALRAKWNIPKDKLVVLSVASMDEPYKRTRFLIETLAALGEPNLFLVMAGQNQGTVYAQETMALAAEKLPGQHLQLTVPYPKIPELYQTSDIFMLGSLQEGFGKVYLEAMASQLPMLCHRSPNTMWILNNPDSLVDMEDSASVQNALRSLIRKTEAGLVLSDKARTMAMKNQAWVNERFSWHRLRDEYLQMYERITYLPS